MNTERPQNLLNNELTKLSEGACVSSVSASDKGFQDLGYWLGRLKAVQDNSEPIKAQSQNPLNEELTKLTEGQPDSATEPFNQRYMDAIKAGHSVRVWCGTLNEWVYWVRDDQIKKRLQANGCELVIYSLGELAVIASMPAKDTKQIHELKKTFDVKINPPTHNGTRQ